MIIALAVIAGICVLAYIYFNQKAKSDELIGSGKMQKRDFMFWKSAELFHTTATYEQVRDAAKEADLSETFAFYDDDPSLDKEHVILFKSKKAWNAAITDKGPQEDGKNLYRFSFTTWKTENGLPTDENSMNVMMTTAEKIFLSIDPETTVESQRLNIKSKTKFF